MHDLSQFMKTLLQRFTRWFNLRHNRRGHLWEERFRSVIVESGLAARTVAAYIDLNPVRAGIVADPAAYRWSGYGEAAGIASRRNGQAASQLARAALARVCELCRADFSDPAAGHPDHPPDPSRLPPIHPDTWKSTSRDYRRAMGLALERKPGLTTATRGPSRESPSPHDSSQKSPRPVVEDEPDPQIAAMLRHRVRYFSDGAVIGGRDFVDQTFAAAPERFGSHRKTGARKFKGKAALAAKCLWSVRDLRPDPPTE